MELVQLPKQLISVDKGSEDGNDESVLIANSRTVSEVASVFGSQSLEHIDAAPGNTVSMQSGLDSSFVKKTTIVDDGDDHSMVSHVRSLKNFNKSNEDLHKRKRFNKNKVSPSHIPDGELERPTSAPLNRDRKWLEELNMNRPMTAAAKYTLSITPPLQKKVDETASLKEEIVEEKEIPKDVDPIKPNVKETAYIPYEYAQAMISRIVEDMNKMKTHHLNIISRMEQQYQQMEVQTQGQFDECISQIQEKHSKRLDHFRQVIDVLTAELKSKGSIRAEAIQTLREKNKELALERKKMQQQLSSSKILIVPQDVDNRDQKQAPETIPEVGDEESPDDKHSVEEKILEDSQETEKKIIPVPVPVADTSDTEEDEEERKEDEETAKKVSDDVEKEAEGVTVLDGEEAEVLSEKHEGIVELDEEEIREAVTSEDEAEERLEEDEEEKRDLNVPIAVPLAIIEEGDGLKEEQGKEPSKSEKAKKPTKTPTSPKKESSPKRKVSIQKQAEPVSSADQALQNKQQIILAKKHDKRIKELEKAVELERKKLEQNRKSAKVTEADLEEAKNEISILQKNIAQQKAELAKLEDAAGAGAIALQQLPELKTEVKTLTAENQNLVNNYNTERVLRKKYYNMVEDMKGKIRVYCRVRPLSKTEKANKNQFAVQTPDEYTIKVEMNRGGIKEFQFDEIFSETSTQTNVFEDTNSLIQSAVDGYNVCIFAYGQTGSGKTYTMIGDKEQSQPGIAPRAFDRIFDIAKQNKKKFTFKISCYMLELYNEKLVDLLSTNKDDSIKLDIKKDNKGMVVIQGTEVIGAESSEELFDIFQKGSANRHTASTKMNDESSRSHLVIGITIESTNLVSGAITRGKLSLVDLAGSERVAKTGATAQQLKEANSINKSLSALGDVISALSSEQSFIPYRNNKLTMLMQDSLGGNAKTLMFVNVSPADYNSDETAISLTYAARVKLIKNDATKMADSKEVNRLKQIIAKLKAGEALDE